MWVTAEHDVEAILAELSKEPLLSVDTETTGLRPYHGDELFAIIVGSSKGTYFFDFYGHRESIPRDIIPRFSVLFSDPSKTLFLANAKFDMHFLRKEGITEFSASVHDVLVMERLIDNTMLSYSLSSVAKNYGLAKSDEVEKYIKEHSLYEWVSVPGKKTRQKNKFFKQVPLDLMVKYALTDGEVTYKIGEAQIPKLAKMYKGAHRRNVLYSVPELEKRVTKVCFAMELEGIIVDADFCKSKDAEETSKYKKAAAKFKEHTGVALIDSNKCYSPIFNQLGFTPPQTEKGHESFSDDWLKKLSTPIAGFIREFREHSKNANTYYKNFLWHADDSGVLRASMLQAGTTTGRFSYRDPNLQNVPDSEVRKAFIPPKDFCLVSIDFSQQEYRVMLDYAEEMSVVQAVLHQGLDIHQATANVMGVERTPAKTINFLLLYGGGTVKLALTLLPVTLGERELWAIWREYNDWFMKEEDEEIFDGISPEDRESNLIHLLEAERLRKLYFSSLPNVTSLIKNIKEAAEENGFVRTWAGRILRTQPGYAYKAPNAIIQGGSADIMKYALIKLYEYLSDKKSKLLISVHDECLFKVHKDEINIVPELEKIMKEVYPHVVMPMDVSVSHSWVSWGDLVDGRPSV